jgi:hypothetical protein
LEQQDHRRVEQVGGILKRYASPNLDKPEPKRLSITIKFLFNVQGFDWLGPNPAPDRVEALVRRLCA